MRKNNLSIHSENILPIIKKWLYSDKDIFVRELISNATDAIQKLRIINGQEGTISVTLNKKEKTIVIADTGVGMSEEEVEKYIAQIAFSGAEEFVAKYSSGKEAIIGHFGLGFYSAYMVASKVEIQTLSWQEGAKPVVWTCDGSSSYEIGLGERKERGTQITLFVDENSLEYLEEEKMRELLERHCSFMPFAIVLNEKPLGNSEPLWKKAPSECTEEEYLAFYRKLFPQEFRDPIFWIHLNVDYPFHLQGILYFPKVQKRFDGKESAIQLFCNRVFVSDNCKEILPDYLMLLKGAIDSPDIPLNVSRSYLQVDKDVKQISSHIAKKVSDRLVQFQRNEKEKFIEAWPDLEMLVKLGVLQDEKWYERVKEILIWKNNKGEWAPLDAAKKKVFYATAEKSPLLKLYDEVVLATSPVDTALFQFLEEKLSIQMQRIDSAVEGELEKPELSTFIKGVLENVDVEAKSLQTDQLPGLVILDEKSRRFRDYLHLTQGVSNMPTKKTFVVNTKSKLVQAVEKLMKSKPEIAKELAKSLYDLTLLGQKETDPADLEQVVIRQTQVLEKIADLLV